MRTGAFELHRKLRSGRLAGTVRLDDGITVDRVGEAVDSLCGITSLHDSLGKL